MPDNTLVVPELITDGYKIRFEAKHPSYGHAEFVFCVKWNRGKIERVWCTTAQQVPRRQWVVECGRGADSFTASSWTHKGIEEPRMWISSWCREHKAVLMNYYVPLNANVMTLSTGSTVGFHFDRE